MRRLAKKGQTPPTPAHLGRGQAWAAPSGPLPSACRAPIKGGCTAQLRDWSGLRGRPRCFAGGFARVCAGDVSLSQRDGPISSITRSTKRPCSLHPPRNTLANPLRDSLVRFVASPVPIQPEISRGCSESPRGPRVWWWVPGDVTAHWHTNPLTVVGAAKVCAGDVSQAVLGAGMAIG